MEETKKQEQVTPSKPKFETPEDGVDLFVTAEDGYVNQGMRVCMEAFLQRLEARVEIGHPILSEDDIHHVFGSYRLVYEFNKRMLKALKELRMVSKDHLLQNLGNTVWQFVPFFKVYQDYNSKFNQIATTYNNLTHSSSSFSRFCAVGKHVHGKSLDFYLKLPVKRLPRYLRSLAEIYEAIPDKYESYANDIARAAFGIKKITDDITSAIKVSDMQRLVFELNAKIFGGRLNGILIPKRYVIYNGKLKYVPKDAKFKNIKEHSVIVFNDLLLWGTAKTMFSGGNVEGVLPCHGVVAERLASSREYVAKHQFKVTSAQGDFAVFAAGSEAEIDKWLKYIAEAKEAEDHTLQPTNPAGLLERVQGKAAAGQPETIMVTDEKRKAEIKAWEESKKDPAEFKPLLRAGDEYNPPSPLHRSMTSIGAAPVLSVSCLTPTSRYARGVTSGAPHVVDAKDAAAPPPVPGSPPVPPRPQRLQAPGSPRRGRGAAPPPPRSPNRMGRTPPPPPRRGATSAPPPPTRTAGAAGALPPLNLGGAPGAAAAPPPFPAVAGAPPPAAAAGAPPPAPAIGAAAPPPVPGGAPAPPPISAIANGPPIPPPAAIANGAPPAPKPPSMNGIGGHDALLASIRTGKNLRRVATAPGPSSKSSRLAGASGASGRDALLAAIRGGNNLRKADASAPAAKAAPRGSTTGGGGGGINQVLGDIRRGITLRKTATTKPPVQQRAPPTAARGSGGSGGNDLMSLLNNSLQNYRRFVEDDDGDDDDDEDWA